MPVAQKAYAILPAFAQDLAISALGLHYRWQRLGGPFQGYVNEFRERESWSADQFHGYCRERLRHILVISYDSSSYYRRRMTEAGVQRGDLAGLDVDQLHLLPQTPKEDVRRHPQSLLCLDEGKHPRLHTLKTSGSTGTPTTIYMTTDTIRRSLAAREARSFAWAGVTIRSPRATIGARLVVPDPDSQGRCFRYNLAEKQVYLSAFHLSPRAVTSYVEGLNRYRPKVFTGLAHSFYTLAQLMMESGLSLDYRPHVAILGSEKVWPHMRETIERGLGVRVYEEYGSVENCVLATECEEGRLHVHPDFGILEVLDDRGLPSPPGQAGRIVGTGLINTSQPLIRYEIGDVGAFSADRCTCGRDLWPVLQSIVGRQNDVIVTADGRRIIGGDEIFSGLDDVIEGQIVQEALGRFTIKVVAADGFGLAQSEQLQQALRKRVGEATVDVEVVRALERSHAGKFKPIISRLTAHEQDSGPSAWDPLESAVNRADRSTGSTKPEGPGEVG